MGQGDSLALLKISTDLIRDMHNERSLMVQELSAATAVEVQRKSRRLSLALQLKSFAGHVASMNAQLEEKRQELEGLESQRKDLEATISDLLRIQSRYKGPQSVSLIMLSLRGMLTVEKAHHESTGTCCACTCDAWRHANAHANTSDAESASNADGDSAATTTLTRSSAAAIDAHWRTRLDKTIAYAFASAYAPLSSSLKAGVYAMSYPSHMIIMTVIMTVITSSLA